jgi:hypothetical protein
MHDRRGLDLEVADFANLSEQEQVKLCIAVAERAQRMGESAPVNQRLHFFEISSQWLELAALNLRKMAPTILM